MRILIATHQYFFLGGTETFTYTLAVALKKAGHKVVIYSPYAGGLIAGKTRAEGVTVVDNIDALRGEQFDLIHAQHNVTAIEARNAFPKTPMIFLSHGVAPFLEQPPVVNLGVTKFLAVSEKVRDNLVAHSVPKRKVEIFRNIIDTERFKPERPIRKEPKKALIISNTLPDDKREIIEKACEKLGIEARFIGRVGEPVWEVEKEINKADIVFALGRAAVEALSCGRVVIVYDYNGGDGLVTKDNIDEIQKFHFSGRIFKKEYTVNSLAKELKRYSRQLGNEGRELALARFSAQRRIGDLLDIYQQVSREDPPEKCDWELIRFLSTAFAVTRQTSLWRMVGDQKLEELMNQIRNLKAELDGLHRSRSWKLLEALRKLKRSLPLVRSL